MADDLWRYVAYRCVVGSRAYGLEHEGSDTDLRGFFIPPAERHWSMEGLPEQLESAEGDECYWEIEKFLQMCLKGAPNALECLATPLVAQTSAVAEELRAMPEAFLSKEVYNRYLGYADAQFRKMEADMRLHGQVKWKHAMHMIRLLIAGEHVVRTGQILVDVRVHREMLLAIKHGERTWDEVSALRADLTERLQAAFASCPFPEGPDVARVDAFLIRVRRGAVST